MGGDPETGSAHTSPWCPRVTFQGLWDFAVGGQLCLELRVTPELDKQVGAAPCGDWKGEGGVLGCEERDPWGNREDHGSPLSLHQLWLPGCSHVPGAVPPDLTSQAGWAPSCVALGVLSVLELESKLFWTWCLSVTEHSRCSEMLWSVGCPEWCCFWSQRPL